MRVRMAPQLLFAMVSQTSDTSVSLFFYPPYPHMMLISNPSTPEIKSARPTYCHTCVHTVASVPHPATLDKAPQRQLRQDNKLAPGRACKRTLPHPARGRKERRRKPAGASPHRLCCACVPCPMGGQDWQGRQPRP